MRGCIRQQYVIHSRSGLEQRRYLFVAEAGDAATDAGDKELQLGMSLGECYELVDVGLDSVDAALHGGDEVRHLGPI